MKKLTIILAAIISLVFTIGLLSQGEAGEILGCYQKEHGQLRVVNDHSECLNSEEPITLNQASANQEYCFTLDWEHPRVPIYVEKFVITYFGSDMYQALTKKITQDGHVVMGIGNWLFNGGQVMVSMNYTHSDTQPSPTMEATGYECQYFLDSITLNGSGWCLETTYTPLHDEYEQLYSNVTVTKINCP